MSLFLEAVILAFRHFVRRPRKVRKVSRRGASLRVLVLWLSAAHLVAAISTGCGHDDHVDRIRALTCLNNVRNMAVILSERSVRRGWPPYGGRNFVLSLVADDVIDTRNPDNLGIFVCPTFAERGPWTIDYADWSKVTRETLATTRLPNLTSYAGRRNDEPKWRLVEGDALEDKPIIGCRHGPDHVVLGYSNGKARMLDRKDLGLGRDDPILFGDASESPLLRALSED